MLCEICGKNDATIHIQEIVNSKKKAIHMCKHCAKNKNPAHDILNGLDLAQLMYNISSDFSGNSAGKDTPQAALPPNIKCPGCGLDIISFTNKGRLGCFKCFKIFRPILDQAIKNMHKGNLHVGKKPGKGQKAARSSDQSVIRLMELQKQLDEHILREEYEKAAQIRDQISAIKNSQKTIREKNDDKRKSGG
jgi:protein arginine kinase activator